MSKTNLFENLDPELLERMTSRRDALREFGKFGIGKAAASVPLVMAAMATKAFGQAALPQAVVDVLNFALTLEYLEAEFYTMGTSTDDSTIVFPSSDIRQTFGIIRDHEQAHVEYLENALGPQAVDKPTFDFTAGGAFPTVFSDYATFVTLATAFEDTGVRAYKGQAPALIDYDDVLTAALTIHSIEARHASKVRRLAASYATQGWIPGNEDGAPDAVAAVYAGENVTTQATIDVAAISAAAAASVSMEDVTEAFDEPLSMEDVLAIVDPFIVGN